MAFLDELTGSTAPVGGVDIKQFLGPIMEAMAAEAKRASDPISRIGDVGSAVLGTVGSGIPYPQGLAALDKQRSDTIKGGAQLFLSMLGQERQIKALEAEQSHRRDQTDIAKMRLALDIERAGREEGDVKKVGETSEGIPIYAFVTKSGRVTRLGTEGTPSAPSAPSAPAAGKTDAPKADEVLGLLDQAKRGPQYVWQNRRKDGEPQAITPPRPFTMDEEGAVPAQSGEKPPYRIYKGKPVLTPAQVAVDRDFGKQYADFVAAGGVADAQKGLAQIKSIRDRMRAGESFTGPISGTIPRGIRSLTHPSDVQALEMVEEFVQKNLRAILGAQFTKEEGFRLVERAYNPKLSREANLERLNRLVLSAEQALDAKKQSIAYFEKHGTMAGYRGPRLLSVGEIESTVEGRAPRPAPTGLPPGFKLR